MTRVLITGVRGKTGLPLARSLAARAGVEVLGGSSDPSTVEAAGVTPTPFSWDDRAGWRAAAESVDAVFVVRPDREDAPELVASFLDALPTDARVVLLSERSPEAVSRGDWAARTELAVTGGERSWTILRPSWFMQVLEDERFLRAPIASGELPFADGGGRVSWIDARDIAAVAEVALLDGDHGGEVYELSGPRALSLPETAAALSEALGRPVRHIEQSVDDAVDGQEGFARELDVITFERVAAGVFASVTDGVERATGRAPRPIEDYLAEIAADVFGASG